MANSLDSVYRQFDAMGMPPLPAEGIQINAGRILRYGPKKKAWYKVFEYVGRNGKSYYTGVFGFKGDGPWKVESDWSDLDTEERDKFHRDQEAAAKLAEEKRQQRAEAAARRAGSQWRMAKKEGISDYLVRKQVKAESVRFATDGTLLVPALRYDLTPAKLVGVQKILTDGQKRFNAGMAKEGSACRLGNAPKDGDLILIGEGYATGGTIRLGIEFKYPVYVAFDAGNLLSLARILRAKYPSSPILFCADDDRATEGNPGITKATKAASEVGNANFVSPVFSDSDTDLTDFNDLHVAEGVSAVAAQITTAIESLLTSKPSPAPLYVDKAVKQVCAFNLESLLAHFAVVYGKTDVWDGLNRQLMKRGGFVAAVGKELANEWMNHPQRRTLAADSLPRLKRGRPADGGEGDRLSLLITRFTLLYGTVTVWDREARKVLNLESLRAAYSVDAVKRWQEHAARQMIDAENLVFDPTQQSSPLTHINMFEGLPLKPHGGIDKCAAILDLLAELCSAEKESAQAFEWIIKWIAYPLQHPGAKMQTAVLMFGEKQGTGKSLFWEGIVKAIYGEYGTTAGQHQLDSQFTEWRSRKLFVVFEEVLSRSERYNFIGTIKHMITGRTQRINPKGLPEREESNHLNSAFLSNEPQPIPLELEDRRFMVVEARNVTSLALQAAVKKEMAEGGIEAFYRYLLAYPLGDFDPHTKPLHTAARDKIIAFGMPGWEVFYRDWKEGLFSVPYCSCRTSDLYTVYKRWCDKAGEKAISQTKFSTLLSNRETKTKAVIMIGSDKSEQRIFKVDPREKSLTFGMSVSDQCEKFHQIADIKG